MKKIFASLLTLAMCMTALSSCTIGVETESTTLSMITTKQTVLSSENTSNVPENQVTTENSDTTTPTTKALESTAKPVIYLYPEKELDVSVKLYYGGTLTCTYPEYGEGWSVTARPDGTLIDKATGKEYSYLFWEGVTDVEYDMSRGFCVRGEDTAEFLQETLAKIGLTPREYNEFIVYWLPKMQENEYNLISFQYEAYTDNAVLDISPAPDSILRVFMAYLPLAEEVKVEPQEFGTFVREGFTVVEWGGTEINWVVVAPTHTKI